MGHGGSVYILSNKTHSTLYVGVTSDLYSRVSDHKTKRYPLSFSAKYNVNKLVYFENFHSIEEAIAREKQIKGGSKQKKLNLINSQNSEWADLFEIIKKW